MSISYNKSLALTGIDIYNQTYDSQSIQLLSGATSFLVGALLSALIIFIIENILIDKNSNPYFYMFFISIIVVLIIIPLTINLFTYQKIKYSKNIILEKEY
jgi:hypothetical protein